MQASQNILYAEDNPDDAIIFQLAYSRAGLTAALRCVDDGEDAISWLLGEGPFADRNKYPLPDILVLDLKMPRKSGFDVLEWLAVSPTFRELPVIVLSSSDDPRDVTRAKSLGVTTYFMKTADYQDVIAHLLARP